MPSRNQVMARRLAVLPLALVLLAGPLSPIGTPAQAQTRDPGIGGTGEQPDEGNGIGGTGDHADNDPGIGGTGIIGVITGFGSIYVNGYEIDPAQAKISDDFGGSHSQDDFEIGQVVEVEAQGAGQQKRVTAKSIVIRHEVSGKIDAIDHGTGALTVLGQRIDYKAGTGDVSGFTEGDVVTVSGFRRSDGTIEATRIVRAAPGRPMFLRGHVDDVDAGGFVIAGTRIFTAADERPAHLRAGSDVTIFDPRLNVGAGRQRIELAPDVPFGGRYRRVSLEGYVANTSDREFFLGRTRFERNAELERFRVGDRMIVEGAYTADHRLVPNFAREPSRIERGRPDRPRRFHDQPPLWRERGHEFERQRFRQGAPGRADERRINGREARHPRPWWYRRRFER